MFEPTCTPSDVSFSSQPEVHPKWHVYQHDVSCSLQSSWQRCSSTEAFYDPPVSSHGAGVLLIKRRCGREFPAGQPQQRVYFDARQLQLESQATRKHRLTTAAVSDNGDTHVRHAARWRPNDQDLRRHEVIE